MYKNQEIWFKAYEVRCGLLGVSSVYNAQDHTGKVEDPFVRYTKGKPLVVIHRRECYITKCRC
jgi:hypothetical protein